MRKAILVGVTCLVSVGGERCLAQQPVLQPIDIYINERKGDWVDFDIDYGAFMVSRAQAYVGKAEKGAWQRVRLPAAVSKAGRSWDAYDFVNEEAQAAVHAALMRKLAGEKMGVSKPFKLREKDIAVVSLKPDSQSKGSRLASGELWIAGAIAVKLTLNRSKWSDELEHSWVGFSGQWVKDERVWHDVLVFKEKSAKKMVDALVRGAYQSRYMH
ncbi:MAG: hypothetical protein AABZ44_00340 [Elusimicrobiota bacterium]